LTTAGELTVLNQTPLAGLRGPTIEGREGREGERLEKEGTEARKGEGRGDEFCPS